MDEQEHSWELVQFVYASWIECKCGFAPNSQEDIDNHIPELHEVPC